MAIIKADLHYHGRTGTKPDFSADNIRRIFRKAEETLGEGGVLGMTNFVYLKDNRNYELFCKDALAIRGIESAKGILIASRYSNIRVLKCVEFATDIGHILGIGMPSDVEMKPQRDWREVIKIIQSCGGIVALPHAYSWIEGVAHNLNRPGRKRDLGEVMNAVDGIEIVSGEAYLFPGANAPANFDYLMGLRTNTAPLGFLGCSDGHTPFEVGDCSTSLALEEAEDKEKLVRIIRTALASTHRDSINSNASNRLIGVYGAIYHGINLIRAKFPNSSIT